MVYLDTSFLAPFYLPESKSKMVEAAILGASPGTLVISRWTQTEFVSAVMHLAKVSALSMSQSAEIIEELISDIQGSYNVVTPDADDYELADRTMAKGILTLSPGDALHLAIAINGDAEALWTLDQGMAKAATELGLAVLH